MAGVGQERRRTGRLAASKMKLQIVTSPEVAGMIAALLATLKQQKEKP
jgi:hypothetical protein